MAQANIERQVGSRGTPHVGHTDSVMNDERGSRSDISDRSSSNPVTRVIKVPLPTPTISLYNHSYIYTRIHPFHTSKSLHMQIIASKGFASRHEAEVVSFEMSCDRPGFEGQPTKGSRPHRVKQS